MSGWRHARALGLPVTVALLVPALILSGGKRVEVGWGALPGAALIVLGCLLVGATVMLLARVGKGTLAPWDPTSRLVVRGPYRHVRNPMISGVAFILLGEAAAFGSLPLLTWFAAFAALNAIYMPFAEEPSLRRRFGKDYEHYRANVPRWLPRLRPWDPG